MRFTHFLLAATLAAGTALLLGASRPAPAASLPFESGTFDLDGGHSTILFRIKHLDVAYAYGRFNKMTGGFVLDEDPTKCAVSVEIDATSVDSASEDRDKHLRSPDFLNAVQYPKITFESASVTPKSADVYTVTGPLTFHGTTKEITIDMEFLGSGDKGQRFGYRAGFLGSFTIKRRDFGVDTYPDEVLSDEIVMTLAIEGLRQ